MISPRQCSVKLLSTIIRLGSCQRSQLCCRPHNINPSRPFTIYASRNRPEGGFSVSFAPEIDIPAVAPPKKTSKLPTLEQGHTRGEKRKRNSANTVAKSKLKEDEVSYKHLSSHEVFAPSKNSETPAPVIVEDAQPKKRGAVTAKKRETKASKGKAEQTGLDVDENRTVDIDALVTVESPTRRQVAKPKRTEKKPTRDESTPDLVSGDEPLAADSHVPRKPKRVNRVSLNQSSRSDAPATKRSSYAKEKSKPSAPDITFSPPIKEKSHTKEKSKERAPDVNYIPPKREPWQSQKDALKRKFGSEGWNPRKKLSPDTLDGIRALHEQYPEQYTTPVLAQKFEVSAEAIRRILKSKWRAGPEKMEERRDRWAKRHDRIWDQQAALGLRPLRTKDRLPEEDPDGLMGLMGKTGP